MARSYTQRPAGPVASRAVTAPGRPVPALGVLSAALNTGASVQGLNSLGGVLNAQAQGGVVQRGGELDPENTPDWLDTWYAKTPEDKTMTADRKFAQMLNNLLPGGGRARQKKIDELDWSQLKGSFIDAMLTYQVHMAPFLPQSGQGLDRNRRGRIGGKYFRSNEHRLKTLFVRVSRQNKLDYRRATRPRHAKAMWPMNKPLIKTIRKKAKKVPPELNRLREVQGLTAYDRVRFAHFPSLGVTQNPLQVITAAREIVEQSADTGKTDKVPMSSLIDLPPRTGRYKATGRTLAGVTPEQMIDKSLAGLAGLTAPDTDLAYREFLIRDRGATSDALSDLVNDDGNRDISAVGVEGHPSLIIHNAGIERQADRKRALREWEDNVLEGINQGGDPWQVLAAKRGSFGFPRPSTAPMLPSLRLWPGFAPFELLAPGVANTLGIETDEEDIAERAPVGAEDPQLYVEALKAAVRHAAIAMRRGGNAAPSSAKETAIRNWLLTRMAINLEKARYLLAMPRDTEEFNLAQHYQKVISVVERLQEYTFLYTGATFDKDRPDTEPDPYLRYLDTAKSVQGNQREVFYLDNGMQAINAAILLAESYRGRDARMKRPYFETDTVRSAMGIKLAEEQPADDDDAVLLSDLSPVIKDPANARNPKRRIGREQHLASIAEGIESDTLPVFDVTNSSLREVDTIMGQKHESERPRNFLIVESLTKHSQLGTDKYTTGRLIAVGDAEFLEQAKAILQPIADAAHHPLLAEYRRNMDEVLYGDTVIAPTEGWAESFGKTADRYDAFMAGMGFGPQWASTKGGGESSSSSQDATANPRAGFALLHKAFDLYVQAVASSGKMPDGYERAFAALPLSDRAALTQRIERRVLRNIAPQSDAVFTTLPLGASTATGIENLGATCYLAAGLNMLAFSRYRDFFTGAIPEDARQGPLRVAIGQAVQRIRGGQVLDAGRVRVLLNLLRAGNLLPEGSAEDERRGKTDAQIQHDPHEVFFGKILSEFGADMDAYKLEQRSTATPLDRDNATPHQVAELDEVSVLDARGQAMGGQLTPQIELPITGVNDLAGALANYFQPEQIDDYNFIDPRVAGEEREGPGWVSRGPATRQLSLGDEVPPTLTIMLKRWNVLLQKDRRPIGMPERFDLNGNTYRLDTVLYQSGNVGGGHYTASTRNPADQQNWQYRDDRTVAVDPSFNARKPYGYIFTYSLEGPADPLRQNFDLRHPPQPAPLPQQPDPEDALDDLSQEEMQDVLSKASQAEDAVATTTRGRNSGKRKRTVRDPGSPPPAKKAKRPQPQVRWRRKRTMSGKYRLVRE